MVTNMRAYYKRYSDEVVAIFGLSYALDFQLRSIHRKMLLLESAKAFSVVIHVVSLVSATVQRKLKHIYIYNLHTVLTHTYTHCDYSRKKMRCPLTHTFTCILHEILCPFHLISFQKSKLNRLNFVLLQCRPQLFSN